LEAIELCLDEGLGIGDGVQVNGTTYGTEFDIDNLLRMDASTQITMLKDGVSAAIYSPNEARGKVSLAPVAGGEVPYLQQQNWPIDVLSERGPPDAKPAEQMPPADPAANDNAETKLEAAKALLVMTKGLPSVRR
jgi:hypothetical protein